LDTTYKVIRKEEIRIYSKILLSGKGTGVKMGKTSVFAEISKALKATQCWPVTEASKLEYFNDDTWMDEVASCEEFDDGSYKFNLKNGDFVVVEKN
jgi:hypothetical protein